MDKDLKANHECDSRVHSQTLGGLQTEIARLSAQVAMEKEVHESTAEFLVKRNTMLTKEIHAWVDKHDNDKENKEKAGPMTGACYCSPRHPPHYPRLETSSHNEASMRMTMPARHVIHRVVDARLVSSMSPRDVASIIGSTLGEGAERPEGQLPA